MSHKSPTDPHLNPRANAVGIARSLSLITLPFLFGLVTLRQLERNGRQLGQLTESLLQGERLPILSRTDLGEKTTADS